MSLQRERKSIKSKMVVGNKLVEVETVTTVTDLHVNFKDILSATHVIPDEEYRKPWDDDDYLDHEAASVSYWEHDGITESAGFVRGDWRDSSKLITLKDTKSEYEYFRKNGATRQVAAELQAESNRKRLEQLVKWYSEGWEWYGVACSYEGYNDSLNGFASYEDAYEERVEIARTVASQMEADDFIVLNKPDREPKKIWARERIRRQLNLFNTEGRK